MAEYKNPLPISKKEAEKIFSIGSNDQICNALLAITLYDKDWRWAQMHCLHFLNHVDSDISGLAATCLGHIARIHHKLDQKLVINALKNRLSDIKISGRVQDALDDIEIFL
ncbi:MAG: hypothetical protein K0Q74_1477 [Gammaproteobacteria bacterium]|jgi:hypothetical protein|nr:hypothetical protein [Gammaproteobacteria bacterium]